jgi:hypothetical protein
MWHAEKIHKAAKAIQPVMSAGAYAELQRGLDSYGLDHGSALLLTFGSYFTAGFMRQFYSGSVGDFWSAWEKLQSQVELTIGPSEYGKWVKS